MTPTRRSCLLFLMLPFVVAPRTMAADEPAAPAASQAAAGTDPAFFPIAVWLQNPSNAAKYRAAGINLYVGLWRGPTDEQLAELKKHDLRVICSQNQVGLAHKDDPVIFGWMHGDEPDNAQARRGGGGYGPPVLPEKIVEDYRRIKERDPSRPVLLNLGQGVAWDGWYGRGTRTNHPEDYPEYVRGCDIASFDIYPACHDHPDVAGKLWFVADGVRRLRGWAREDQPVWNCIETTRISNLERKATPREVKAEVWMSLVRGSRGLIYFAHQFKPEFIEAGLLADAEMLAEVTRINRQIHELAPVLNAGTSEVADVTTSDAAVPVEILVKRHCGALYIFAVAMRDGTTTVEFKVADPPGATTVEVLGEDRRLTASDGIFKDTFDRWAVHLYRIGSP